MKRLEITPGFIAALCLLRLLAEPGIFCAFLAAAAAHEAGHLIALYLAGAEVRAIRLDAFDAKITAVSPGYREEIICALAGPGASVALCLAARKMFPSCAAISLILGIFNVLPVYPLDGGRALRAGLLLHLLPDRAERICAAVGALVCAAGLAGAVFLSAARRLGIFPVLLWGMLLFRLIRYAGEEGTCFSVRGRV